MSWIITVSGRKFDPLNPDPAAIEPDDIAHALANLCRFNGHTREFYSVAQHCSLVAGRVSRENRLAALLHDAAEAYVGDMVMPLKHSGRMAEYLEIEAGVEKAICKKFGLVALLNDEIKAADLLMLATEKRDLLPDHPAPWPVLEGIEPAPWHITPCMPGRAARRWLDQVFEELWPVSF